MNRQLGRQGSRQAERIVGWAFRQAEKQGGRLMVVGGREGGSGVRLKVASHLSRAVNQVGRHHRDLRDSQAIYVAVPNMRV